LSTADIVLCIVILIGAIAGYREGFLMELFSLVAILLGILGGFKLMGWAMLLLAEKFNIDQKVLPYIAFAVVFIAIVIVVQLLGRILKASVDKTFLGRLDQIAGSVLGFFKMIFLASVAIWLVASFDYDFPEKWTNDSWLFPRVAAFAPETASWISEIFPVFRDIF
jgi:membrane protein required for colicin V production